MAGIKEISGIWLLLALTFSGALKITKTIQTSTWNNYTSDKGVDASNSTCAKTGFEFQPEWTAELDGNYSIHHVYVKGEDTLPNLRIAVNDDTNPNGQYCYHIKKDAKLSEGKNFTCKHRNEYPRGTKVTLKIDVVKVGVQLNLCDVKIYGN